MRFSLDTRTAVRSLAIAVASVTLMATGAQAQGHHSGGGGRGGAHFGHGGPPGGFHGGHVAPRHGYYPRGRYGYYPRGGGWGWGGVGLGLGLGVGLGLSSYYDDPVYSGYTVVGPPVVYPQPVPLVSGPAPAYAPAQAPAPVIYPRNGQDAARIDADSNACSQWAGAQPNATADPTVFRRAVDACMDARGYTLR